MLGRSGSDREREDAHVKCHVCRRNGAKQCTSHKIRNGKVAGSDKVGFVAAGKG